MCIITNTKFRYKEIDEYTREMQSKNERSILDYLVRR